MKAEELMIGDWVYYSSKKHIVQVVGISGIQYSFNQQDVILYGDCFKDFDGRGRWESHTTKSLSPIHLTQEILEKNGFKEGKLNISPQYCLDDNNVFIGVTLEDIPDKHKGIDITKGRQYFQLDISRMKEPLYVHQLQHALRLCGINKEIVL